MGIKLDIVKLLPHQIGALWSPADGSPGINYALRQSLPPTFVNSELAYQRILQKLLSEGMQCWAAYRADVLPSQTGIVGIMVTAIIADPCTDGLTLNIYSVYGFEFVAKELWEQGLKTLKKFAKGMGCKWITFYTTESMLSRLAKGLGAKTDCTFGWLEV